VLATENNQQHLNGRGIDEIVVDFPSAIANNVNFEHQQIITKKNRINRTFESSRPVIDEVFCIQNEQ
jgi:hypothetical protein